LANKKIEKPRREPTKRQLSRWQQQKRRQRIIFGSGILIVVAVLAVVSAGAYFGWYIPERQPLHETVVKVNETEFDMDYYLKLLKYRILQFESYGMNVSIEQVSYLAEGVVTSIQRNELIKQEAMKLGISVSDEEVEEKVDEELESYDPPLSKDYRDVIGDEVRAGMLVERLRDEYFDLEVPQTAEQRHIMVMFLESQSQVNDVKARLEADEDFGELAAELSLDAYSKSQEGDLGWHSRDILPMLINSPVLEESAFSQEVGILSEPIPEDTKTKMVGYWLIKVDFRDEEAGIVQGRAMLLGSEEEANDIRARLEAGADFATLAEKFSQNDEFKENGGEFEIAEGDMNSAFEEFAFDPEVELETLSQPIRDDTVATEGGYWLVKVVEADNNRQIEDEDRDMLKADTLNKWVEALWDNPGNKVESYLDDEKKDWAIMHALEV
jgi:parvulin-like peptidyl-prolyl isomerase